MLRRLVLVLPLLLPFLAACQTLEGTAEVGSTVEEPFIATDEPARLGREHFARADYGLAQKYFQMAVEQSPSDGDSWIGLAASYDQLGRFDLADRAYQQATRLKGQSVVLLNNRGYSYLLRGDAARAADMFRRAQAMSPADPVVANNIEILRSSPR